MTKKEIQALIDAKIAGQGSAVDVGGALPAILHEILEAAFAGANVQSNWNESDSESPQYIQNKPEIPAPYSLPTASAETLGGVKVGTGLSIQDGVLSAQGGAEPLIFNGFIGMNGIELLSGGATKSEIYEAAINGRPLMFKCYDDESHNDFIGLHPCFTYQVNSPSNGFIAAIGKWSSDPIGIYTLYLNDLIQ